MADANRNSPGSADRKENRQERHRQPVQPGATGNADEATTPEEARRRSDHTFGKTGKHSSGES